MNQLLSILPWIGILLWAIFSVLAMDLLNWKDETGFVYYKIRTGSINAKRKDNKYYTALRERYDNEKGHDFSFIWSTIPVFNLLIYLYFLRMSQTIAHEGSRLYILQDICSWNKGINAFLWKSWKPSKRILKKYPIK